MPQDFRFLPRIATGPLLAAYLEPLLISTGESLPRRGMYGLRGCGAGLTIKIVYYALDTERD